MTLRVYLPLVSSINTSTREPGWVNEKPCRSHYFSEIPPFLSSFFSILDIYISVFFTVKFAFHNQKLSISCKHVYSVCILSDCKLFSVFLNKWSKYKKKVRRMCTHIYNLVCMFHYFMRHCGKESTSCAKWEQEHSTHTKLQAGFSQLT